MTNSENDTLVLPAIVAGPSASAGASANLHVHIHPPVPQTVARPAHKAKVAPPAKPLVVAPQSVAPATLTSALLSDEIKPEYYTDAKTGAQSRRYRDKNNAEAIFTEDPTDHNKVTLALKDATSTLVTQGNARGFKAMVGFAEQSAEPWRILADTVTCGKAKADASVNELESVTRDKLQQFAADHPQLAAAIRKVELPVTVVGGLPVSFAKAVDTPTQYRACPEDRSGIVVERLTEKSAKR